MTTRAGEHPQRSQRFPEGYIAAVRRAATAENVAREILGVKLAKDGTGFCPFHPDGETRNKKSFKAWPGRDGGWKCFNGCGGGRDGVSLVARAWGLDTKGADFLTLIERLGEQLGVPLIHSIPSNGTRLASRPIASAAATRENAAATARKTTTATWTPSRAPKAADELKHGTLGEPARAREIRDERGRLFALHCRFEPEGQGKTFRWWINGHYSRGGGELRSEDAPLYRSEHLPRFDSSRPVFLVEGEKAADALVSIDAQALATVTGGAIIPADPSLLELAKFRGPIVLWADNDDTGRDHMERIRQALLSLGASDVRPVWVPDGLPEKGDAAEWSASRQGASAAEVLAELEASIPAAPRRCCVPARDFIASRAAQVFPLVGTAEECVIADDSLVILFGDGGAGKTTLGIDFARHGCSGEPEWIGLRLPRKLRVYIIENDGTRDPFAKKLEIARERWTGAEYLDDLRIRDPERWGDFSLSNEEHRRELAADIDAESIDLVMLGPLVGAGAAGSGTPDEVSDFDALVKDLRARTRRKFALIVLHHENRAGGVSGAWERLPDTLMHVKAASNGRTLIFWEKVRNSSELHQETWTLAWTGDMGFRREEQAARDYREALVEALADGAWHSSTKLAKEAKMGQPVAAETLAAMLACGEVEYQEGPKGRARNSKCWRLTPGGSASLAPSAKRSEAPSPWAPVASASPLHSLLASEAGEEEAGTPAACFTEGTGRGERSRPRRAAV